MATIALWVHSSLERSKPVECGITLQFAYDDDGERCSRLQNTVFVLIYTPAQQI